MAWVVAQLRSRPTSSPTNNACFLMDTAFLFGMDGVTECVDGGKATSGSTSVLCERASEFSLALLRLSNKGFFLSFSLFLGQF